MKEKKTTLSNKANVIQDPQGKESRKINSLSGTALMSTAWATAIHTTRRNRTFIESSLTFWMSFFQHEKPIKLFYLFKF